MWKTETREDFEDIVSDILADPEVLLLGDEEHHGKSMNRLDHSLYVAYMSFLICQRLKLDHVAAARAGLLHDFFFEDKSMGAKRLWHHPHSALDNAQRKYTLSELEEDIIVKHMWPVTRPLPRHKESFVVCMADKLCAIMEVSRLYSLLRIKKKFSAKLAFASA